MAINATIPGGQAYKPGLFPPKVIRREANFGHLTRLERPMAAADRPRPRTPQVNPVYTNMPGINYVV